MTLKNYLNFLFALGLITTLTSPIQASEVSDLGKVYCDPYDANRCTQRVYEGQLVPFNGQILTIDLAVSLGQKAFYCSEELKLQLDQQAKILRVDLDLEKDLRANEREVYDTRIALLMKKLNDVESSSWYERPGFVVPMTVLATLLVVYGAVAIVKATGDQ